MHNWDYNLKNVDQKDPNFIRWKLERLINFGLGKEKLQQDEVKKYWRQLKIDPIKRNYLKDLLWPKKSLLKHN